jgi:hypothetical protein
MKITSRNLLLFKVTTTSSGSSGYRQIFGKKAIVETKNKGPYFH